MALINSVISWIIKKRIHQINLFIKYPHDVQEEWRKNLIETAVSTEWGKKYHYSTIKTAQQFKQRVPLQNYETLKPYIQRLLKGEQNILWPTKIKWFAKSSGTTSDKSKFIPVTEEALEDCHFNGGKDLLSIYCNNNPDTLIFDGKGLTLGGSHQINQLNNESFYGDLSAVIIQNLPFWVQFIRTPDLDVALLEDFEKKIEKMANTTLHENVTIIAGVPTWTLVLINRLFEKTGKNNLLEIWPNLELFIHGAVSFTPYRNNFNKIIPSASMNYLETYNASEGFFGIQDQSNSEDLLLMLDYGVYYEFIPIDEVENENPKVLSLNEVELNENYALVISTNAGLWRYVIGDTIKFTSLSPYRIRITGRTKHFINAFGEELIIDNTEKALEIACSKTNSVIKDYTAGPIYFSERKNGGHEWLIEFEKIPDDLKYFTYVLDEALKSVNSDYEAKRYKDLALKLPVIHAVPQNTFYNWMKKRDKLGGQNKVPRLSNNRKYLDDILEFLKDDEKK